jgi:hypothetical protein
MRTTQERISQYLIDHPSSVVRMRDKDGNVSTALSTVVAGPDWTKAMDKAVYFQVGVSDWLLPEHADELLPRDAE